MVPQLWLSELPPYRTPKRAPELIRAVFEDLPLWTINRQSADFADARLPHEKEAMAVKRQLRRIIHAIFTGERPPADLPLRLHANPVSASYAPDGAFSIIRSQCSYVWRGQVYTRFSPMCARLAQLAAQGSVPAAAVA